MTFEDNLATGQIGESVISRWLQSKGHSIFPAYQVESHTGKGPQLFTSSGDLVLPDLLAFKKGNIIWFEAKHKTCFTWYRIGKCWTTGIDLRHYEEYQKVEERTELPVWLLFWHPLSEPSKIDKPHIREDSQCPTGLFGNSLKYLTQNENHKSDQYGASGMVYWARKSLKFLARVEEVA